MPLHHVSRHVSTRLYDSKEQGRIRLRQFCYRRYFERARKLTLVGRLGEKCKPIKVLKMSTYLSQTIDNCVQIEEFIGCFAHKNYYFVLC